MGIKFDTEKTGLEMLYKPYQVIALRALWERGGMGIISREAWVQVNKVLIEQGKSISRASIIFFLDDMIEDGFATYTSKSGKGGYHRVYAPVQKNKAEFLEEVSKRIVEKLLEAFPVAAHNAIIKIMGDKVSTEKNEDPGHATPLS